MFILYGIKFEDDNEIYYTTKTCFNDWKKFGAFKIVQKRLIINLFRKVFRINIF